MRPIAAIDLGANSIRMTIAEKQSPGLKILEKIEYPLRLGKETFLKRYISPEALKETINILKVFRKKLVEFGVKRYRAVATSAIRVIDNQDFFLEQVRLKTGINIEIIEKSEEERLVYLGLALEIENFKDIIDDGVTFAKVGSGNVEFSMLKTNEVFFSRSIPIGGLRLRENLKKVSEEHFKDAMEKYVHSDIKMLKQSMPKIKTKNFFASGTLVRMLRKIISPDSNIIHQKALSSFYKDLKGKTITQIAEKYDLPLEYADLLLPTADVYLAFLELADSNKIQCVNISFTGCILNQMAGFFKSGFMTKQIWKSAIGIGDKYHFDKPHALKVSELAVKIFDQLKPIHNLSIKHRYLLKLASLWHDIGIFIKNSAHHKHSYYLISNIEMPGLSSADIQIIATIARYHRRSMPKKYHAEYNSLANKARVVVSKLASILRLADALDRSHKQLVQNLNIDIEENEILINVKFNEGGWLEKIHFDKKKNLFTRVFGINIELIERLR